jgi:folate-binding protein YgfZ
MGGIDADRLVYALTGSDRLDFLQGLVTNDVGRLRDGAVYAALLTPQGKYLADFFLIGAGDAVLLDVHRTLAADLVKRLSMYRLRADVQIAETDLTVARGLDSAPPGAVADPRDPALGWRAYGRDAAGADLTDWTALRVARGVPESGVELIPNETFILEAGFERLHGVDFRKGCYVGQEVTARMKHKTELRKGLARVAVEGAAPPGTEIATAEGKPAGTLYSQADGAGIAYLRFDRATGAMTAGAARVTRLPD